MGGKYENGKNSTVVMCKLEVCIGTKKKKKSLEQFPLSCKQEWAARLLMGSKRKIHFNDIQFLYFCSLSVFHVSKINVCTATDRKIILN